MSAHSGEPALVGLKGGVSQEGSLATRFLVRFGVTFGTNVARAGLSFLSGLLLARGLGPSGYGDLNFLLGSFAAISQFLEMGTSSAFYTFVSRRRRGLGFLAAYGAWVLFQFVAPACVIALALPETAVKSIWVGHARGPVLLAFLTSFLTNQLWLLVNQLAEARRKTVVVQLAAVAQACAHVGLILAATHGGWLSVTWVMWFLVGEFLGLTLVLMPRLLRDNYAPPAVPDHRAVVTEFVGYCAPLIVYGWVGSLYAFADTWMLQQFGGSVQQGFFALGQQFANISLIATSSVLRVFWKEIAEAVERGNDQQIGRLYVLVSRGLYFIGAWISCLLIPHVRTILYWLLGPRYAAAWLPLSIMFLYPIHQSIGQIVGVLFYAKGETSRYARIGIGMMLVSIPVAYFLLAPASGTIPGLGLGALGLVLKMVLVQAVGVNVMAAMIAQLTGVVFAWGYQVRIVGVLLGVGWASKWLAGVVAGFTGTHSVDLVVIALGAVLYTLCSVGILLRAPQLAGLDREEIRLVMAEI